MILLDTNVLSETMRPAPDVAVIEWLDRQDTSALFLTTITVAEIGFELRVLPAGKQRRSWDSRTARSLRLHARIISLWRRETSEISKIAASMY